MKVLAQQGILNLKQFSISFIEIFIYIKISLKKKKKKTKFLSNTTSEKQRFIIQIGNVVEFSPLAINITSLYTDD